MYDCERVIDNVYDIIFYTVMYVAILVVLWQKNHVYGIDASIKISKTMSCNCVCA